MYRPSAHICQFGMTKLITRLRLAGRIDSVLEQLLDKESMTGDQFRSIMEGKEAGEYSTSGKTSQRPRVQ